MTSDNDIVLHLSAAELRYFIACGAALVQNVPEKSLATYCGFTKNQIIEISRKLREIADEQGVDM